MCWGQRRKNTLANQENVGKSRFTENRFKKERFLNELHVENVFHRLWISCNLLLFSKPDFAKLKKKREWEAVSLFGFGEKVGNDFYGEN